MPLTTPQKTIFDDTARFRCVSAGRRFGKSFLSIWEIAKFARYPNRRIIYVAPSYRMAKGIIWDILKDQMIAKRWAKKINESDLTIWLVNGTRIELRSSDNGDSIRGISCDFAVLDECAFMDKRVWTDVIRPTLSDRNGHGLMISTPQGVGNWFYDLYNEAKILDDWSAHSYTTIEGGNVSAEEIDAARRDLSPKTFKQEYEASFETYSGQVYYNYGAHTITQEKIATPDVVLVGMDFNIDPMSACIATRTETGLTIFDEITIHGSNTDEMVQELRNRYKTQRIVVYPDPASRQRKTSAGGRTDLSILVNAGFKIHSRPQHPAVRDRINAVNSALKSVDGKQKLTITPNCKAVIKSLSRQIYKPGTTVPDNNENLSHMADAVGYMVEYLYPVVRHSINNNTAGQTWTMKVN